MNAGVAAREDSRRVDPGEGLPGGACNAGFIHQRRMPVAFAGVLIVAQLVWLALLAFAATRLLR